MNQELSLMLHARTISSVLGLLSEASHGLAMRQMMSK
jgi:hypothetical protein